MQKNFVSSVKIKRASFGALIVAVSFFAGWFGKSIFTPKTPSDSYNIREDDSRYPLIHPLLGCEFGDKKEFEEYQPLFKKMISKVSEYQNNNQIKTASVYFRDLETGKWTGVNEDDKYSPASLYKVVLMTAVLKKAETNPLVLDDKVFFPGTAEKEKPDYEPMKVGEAYTVRELLKRLITLSDNDAKNLLHTKISLNSIFGVFTDMGLTPPNKDDIGDSMSAKDFSRFFRTLYSATYLNRPMSQMALELLKQSEFKEGIQKGVPEGISVAHKFGHRRFDNPVDGATQELHDCGIVYHPIHPYFICVMTKGNNPQNLSAFIQNISKTVYDDFSSQIESVKK